MAYIFTGTQTERKQLTILVPYVLYKALKQRALDANVTMTKLVNDHMAALLGVELPSGDEESEEDQ